LKIWLIAAGILSLAGCASIINDTTHPMKVETKTESGAEIKGAECTISNEYGSNSVKSGGTAQVRRSSKDMDITCVQQGQADAKARVISRANAGLAGNIIFGGAIGAVIDHTKGTAYTYPGWIQLVFGQVLVFDRHNEIEGSPVPAGVADFAKSRNDYKANSTGCYQGAAPCK